MNEQKIRIVHPAYDIVNNILFLGYSDREFNKNYLKERDEEELAENGQKKKKVERWKIKNFHLLVEINEFGKPILEIISDTQKEINNTLYVFEPDENNKDRKLPKITSKWDKELMYKSKWNIKVDRPGLYHKLSSQLRAYVKLEKEEDYDLLLCWIIATYFHQVFEAFPYIHLKGLKGSGKSTCLDFITQTAFNACKDIATFSSMRDKIDGQRATFLVDQADFKLGEKADGEMLNAVIGSYKKSGGRITKSVEIKRRHQNVDFDAYSPKGFASVKELHHDLKDRCIQFIFYKSKTNLEFLKEESNVWLEIRNDLYHLLFSEFANVGKIYTELQGKYQNDQTIKGRQLELWIPIESIMRLFNFDAETIKAIKYNFLSKIKNTEDTLSINENIIIDTVSEILGNEESKFISLREIVKKTQLSNEEKNLEKGENESIHIGHLLKGLNLYSEKKRTSKGWSYKFEKAKIENIRSGDPENHSQILTTEKTEEIKEEILSTESEQGVQVVETIHSEVHDINGK